MVSNVMNKFFDDMSLYLEDRLRLGKDKNPQYYEMLQLPGAQLWIDRRIDHAIAHLNQLRHPTNSNNDDTVQGNIGAVLFCLFMIWLYYFNRHRIKGITAKTEFKSGFKREREWK
jgi:hypothetical protein